MSVYTVQLDFEHATTPTLCWRVWVRDLVDPRGVTPDGMSGHFVYVPTLDAWYPDTLRLVLWELSAYLPAHDPNDAMVRVEAKLRRRCGRKPKTGPPRPLEFDENVTLSVEARGWRASVDAARDSRPVKADQPLPTLPGSYSEPMQAVLLELAARSPFPLALLPPEYSAPGFERNAMPSRLNVQTAREAMWDPEAKQWRDDLADGLEKILKRINGLTGLLQSARRRQLTADVDDDDDDDDCAEMDA